MIYFIQVTMNLFKSAGLHNLYHKVIFPIQDKIKNINTVDLRDTTLIHSEVEIVL